MASPTASTASFASGIDSLDTDTTILSNTSLGDAAQSFASPFLGARCDKHQVSDDPGASVTKITLESPRQVEAMVFHAQTPESSEQAEVMPCMTFATLEQDVDIGCASGEAIQGNVAALDESTPL